MDRIASINRITKETNISLKINLDGNGTSNIKTPIGFLNHMLTLFSFHSYIDIDLLAEGDIDVCDHHLVEDIGISLGKAIDEALSDKKGIKRYGNSFLPMDETLCHGIIDLSGRSFLHFEGNFKREQIGNFSTEMTKEFFRAVAMNSKATLHLRILYGENDHHKIEAMFKSYGRALKEAISYNEDRETVLSTKGSLNI